MASFHRSMIPMSASILSKIEPDASPILRLAADFGRDGTPFQSCLNTFGVATYSRADIATVTDGQRGGGYTQAWSKPNYPVPLAEVFRTQYGFDAHTVQYIYEPALPLTTGT